MPRSERIQVRPSAANANANGEKPTSTAPAATSSASSAAGQVTKPQPSWIKAFLDGLGQGLGKALGSAIGKLLVAGATTGTSYLMYRTQVGYRLACLIWKEDKVDQFVEKSRFTGKMVFGGATVIGLGYISYKSFRAVVWVVDKVSGRRRGSVLEPKREIEDEEKGKKAVSE